MAEIKRYVCTASSGGDGTTSATSGANAAYASLEVCMNANEQDLTDGGGDTFVVEITGDNSTADTTAVTIHNYTTSADYNINIYTTSAARHKGVYSTSYYRSVINSSAININASTVPYVSIKGIQFTGTHAYKLDCIKLNKSDGVGYNTVAYCLFANTQVEHAAIYMYFSDNCKVYNNIFYNITQIQSGGAGCALYANYGAGHQWYNNTIYGGEIGIKDDGATVTIKNNLVIDSSVACYSGTFDTTADNISSDTTSPNDEWDSTTLANAKFVNTGSGTEDLHLQVGSVAIDAGTDLSGLSIFTDDIDGVTRSGTWDIGADEYVAAEVPATVTTFNILRKRYFNTKPPLGSQINWSHPLSQGLVGCWLMNEGGGKTTQDLVSNNSGSLQGDAKFSTDMISTLGAGRIDCLDKGKLTNVNYSIVFKAKITNIPDPWGGIYAKTTDGTNGAFALQCGDSAGLLRVYHDNNNYANFSKVWKTNFTSYNYPRITVVSCKNKSVSFYQNGILIDTASIAVDPSVGSGVLRISSERSGNYSYSSTGQWYFFYIYNRTLSPSEIQSLYVAPYQMIQGPRNRVFSFGVSASGTTSGPIVQGTYAPYRNFLGVGC